MNIELNAESLKKVKTAIARIESGHADYFDLVTQLDTLHDAVTVFLSETEQRAFTEHKNR